MIIFPLPKVFLPEDQLLVVFSLRGRANAKACKPVNGRCARWRIGKGEITSFFIPEFPISPLIVVRLRIAALPVRSLVFCNQYGVFHHEFSRTTSSANRPLHILGQIFSRVWWKEFRFRNPHGRLGFVFAAMLSNRNSGQCGPFNRGTGLNSRQVAARRKQALGRLLLQSLRGVWPFSASGWASLRTGLAGKGGRS